MSYIEQLEAEFEELKKNSEKFEGGTKAAAPRLRKNAMNITKICKDLRNDTLEKLKSM